jgi:hypothetical protein
MKRSRRLQPPRAPHRRLKAALPTKKKPKANRRVDRTIAKVTRRRKLFQRLPQIEV